MCNVCDEIFLKEQQLKDHRRRKHSKQQLADARHAIGEWKCQYCDKGHEGFDAKRKHERRCQKKPKEPLQIVDKIEEDLSETSFEDEPQQQPRAKQWLLENVKKSKKRKQAALEARPVHKKLK